LTTAVAINFYSSIRTRKPAILPLSATTGQTYIVSKHDSRFYTTTSIVIGILVAVAIALFMVARLAGGRTQELVVDADPQYRASVEERIKPLVRIAVAGRDNSALIIQESVQATAFVLPVPKDGAALYEAACKTCHLTGLAGAPKFGDRANWAPRIAQGKATLYLHAIGGFAGKAGVMPAKGGRTDLEDNLIKAGVDYMVSQAL
jgi:cytochrome c5